MKWLRDYLDKIRPSFERGGKLEKLHPLFEAGETFLFTPTDVTTGPSHIRDALDLKRMMGIVVLALFPCIFMGMWNTGYQANLALEQMGLASQAGWRGSLLDSLGIGTNPQSDFANLVHGALFFIPLYLVVNVVGGFWEVLFATIRRHDVNEGFLVTGFLFPLTLPPTIPLWQAALGISFGVVIGKEVFGGTGKNFLNPALTSRAFLYFAYPAEITGERVWVAVDGFTSATPLGAVAREGMGVMNELHVTWSQAFWGTIPGSIGETSCFACLIGALILIITGVGSWRIMAAVTLGALGLSSILGGVESSTNAMFGMSPIWHVVLGGFAFGTVFMATDPVSAAMTHTGQWVYGILIGAMTILIRVINPAFPEGIMLAILFGNVFAPLIDYFVVRANINRRLARNVS